MASDFRLRASTASTGWRMASHTELCCAYIRLGWIGEHLMRTIHTIAFCLFVSAAQSAVANSAEEVRAVNDRWTVAMKSKDMAAVEKIVGPDFVLTRGQALGANERIERPAWIANLKQMSFAVYRADVTDVQ